MSRELDDLDYAVALADGWEPTTAPAHWECNSQRPLKRGSEYMCWDCQGRRFSRDWGDGGPIIERERILLQPSLYGPYSPHGGASWYAEHVDSGGEGSGDTALIAAMRAYVARRITSSAKQGEGK